MSTTLISESVVVSPDGPVSAKPSAQIDVDFATCDCCGLTEECTLAYIENIRERFRGKWVCGLCAEAVKDEILRSQKFTSLEEAMARHFSFCNKFRAAGPPEDPTVRLIRAMSQILRRSLDSPKSMRSLPSSPTVNTISELNGTLLARSGSCMPSLSLAETSVYCEIEEECE